MALLKEYPGFTIEEKYRPIPGGWWKVLLIIAALAAYFGNCYYLGKICCGGVDNLALLLGAFIWLLTLYCLYRGHFERINATIVRYLRANVVGYGLFIPSYESDHGSTRVLPLYKNPYPPGLFLPIGGWFARFCRGTAHCWGWRARLDGDCSTELVKLRDRMGNSLFLPIAEAVGISAYADLYEWWLNKHQRVVKELKETQEKELRLMQAMVQILRDLRRTRQWIKSRECAKIFYQAVEQLDRLASDRLREQARSWQRELAPGDKVSVGGVWMEISPQDPAPPSAEPLSTDDVWDMHMRK